MANLEGKTIEDMSKPWKDLSKIIMAYIIVFNGRRQGEVSKMTVEDYTQLKTGESTMIDGQMEHMAKWEQELVKLLWRVEVIGKRGRTVPILMTSFVKKCMDALLKHGDKAGIRISNKYFFAVPTVMGNPHLRGCDALREH